MQVLFIFMNKIGDVKVCEFDEAKVMDHKEDWQHIATINSRVYLENVRNKNAKLVSELRT